MGNIYQPNCKRDRRLNFLWGMLFFVFILGALIWVKIPDMNRYYKLIYCLFMFAVCVRILVRGRICKNFTPLFWIGFSVFSAVSLFWSREPQFNKVIVVWMVNLASCAVLFTVSTRSRLELFLKLLHIGIVFEFLYIMFHVGLTDMLQSRFTFGEFNSNDVGVHLAYGALICLYLFKQGNKIYLFSYPFMCVSVFMTGSRSAFILLTAGSLVYFLSFPANKREMLKRAGLCAAVIAIASFIVFGTETFYKLMGRRIWEGTVLPLWDKLDGVEQFYTDAQKSNTLRTQFSVAAWNGFLKHTFVGMGIDNFRFYLKKAMDVETYAHNNYLEILANTGLIGFLFYYIPYLAAAFKCLAGSNSNREGKRLAAALLTCISLEDITGVSYYLLFQRLVFIAVMLLIEKEDPTLGFTARLEGECGDIE